MLERQGLVVSRPRGGTFVTRISREDALDLGYTRALLESYAVTVGYERISAAVLAAAAADIVDMGECSLPRELPRLLQIDLAFHRRFVECAQMPRLLALWSSLDVQIGALYIRGIEEFNISSEFVISFHQDVLDAIASGDEALARHAVLEHYVRFNDATQVRSISQESTIATLVAAGR